jgi:lysophospholipase L1-like esterase
MTTILCFGDSNTWGYVPGTDGERFPPHVRWPGVMAERLGAEYRVIEEGLNGRTTVWDDPLNPDRNGRCHLPMLLETHKPLDLVVILLGINDLKHHFHLTARDIAFGGGALVEVVQAGDAGPVGPDGKAGPPAVLLVAPVKPVPTEHRFGVKFEGALERCAGIAEAYRRVADELGCWFFDANRVATCPDTDGLHLDAAAHSSLGAALAVWILDLEGKDRRD